jgi:hypothetical protein
MGRERRIEMIDKRFGRLVVLSEVAPQIMPDGSPTRMFLALCDCGTTKAFPSGSLRGGRTRSCGCIVRGRIEVGTRGKSLRRGIKYVKDKKERYASRTKHGDARRGPLVAEYSVWCGMIGRCEYPKARGYDRYGGRGIKVCKRWRYSYENFLADMGRRPSPLYSIDRKDNDGNYTPSNCRWATKSEQSSNQRPRTKKAA